MRRIPVVVVAGFLGSGKTTLLNHLLARSGGARIAVVVNDFGAVGIDAMLVSGSGGTISLDNGCLCCAVGEDGVGPVLDRLVRDDRDGPDVIVIEASGIAEPGTLVQMVLAAGNPRLVFGGLVEVVDAVEFEALLRRHPTVEKHVGLADLLVLNKVDRADPGKVWRVRRLLRELNDAAPIVPATHSAVDPRLLFDITVVPGRQLMLGEAIDHADDHAAHLHATYDSVSFTSDEPLDPQRLRDLLDRRPAGVYRIKGVVAFGVPGHRQRYVLHTVGRYVRFRRTRWAAGEPRRTSLVLIGSGIDTAAIRAELAACVVDGDSRTDPDAMLPVMRYTFGG
ncbi:GTP-binding protein [Pseudonocardia sp. WMMC193]|uniref:CobW family GTP-binding protein n=1 Tax=Pseudonocardia sp. WMMC193 TaxID=2911965 RepID=UPI001F368AE8|nr:GTP-binding protein [Pseudonocardia sp. WMMC193]MCF7550246.1 GTP-binding protein [Pseudonocardia sp. WMMC193]